MIIIILILPLHFCYCYYHYYTTTTTTTTTTTITTTTNNNNNTAAAATTTTVQNQRAIGQIRSHDFDISVDIFTTVTIFCLTHGGELKRAESSMIVLLNTTH